MSTSINYITLTDITCSDIKFVNKQETNSFNEMNKTRECDKKFYRIDLMITESTLQEI
jgi:hypothetical protein